MLPAPDSWLLAPVSFPPGRFFVVNSATARARSTINSQPRTLHHETARDDFRRWTDCLLDPRRSPGEQRQAAQDWCDWGLAVLGVDENGHPTSDDPFFADTILAQGKAISPLGAARCIREHRRTAVFLQAMDAALRDVMRRFPGETIHVLEAGCGPLAPLALPFALRYPPEQVVFTLLDLHPAALECARRVVDTLGLNASIRTYLAADAITLRLPREQRPHVIACEVLLRALTREPQVGVTFNLAPQLLPGGAFIPHRIDVDAALFNSGQYFAESTIGYAATPNREPAVVELGRVFSLDATVAPPAASSDTDTASPTYPANSVNVPPHDAQRTPLRLLTRIQAWGEHRLGDFESSLNLPERVDYPAELARHGGRLDFVYEASADPGLRLTTLP